MKKNTIKLSLLAFAFAGGLNAYSQTKEDAAKILQHYDLAKGHELVQKLKKENEDNYRKAIELSEVYGWPLTVEKEGYTKVLTGVTQDNMPIYIIPYNQNSVFTARVNMIQTGGSLGYNLNGQNMLLGIWEPGRVRGTHFDLLGAVTVKDGATWNNDGTDSNNSHATHVAGTLIGRGAVNASARGFAYMASLYAHDAAGDTSEALAAALDANNPILVSNHSYGWDPADWPEWRKGAYTAESAAWDDICVQAPYYLPVFAAGNYRVAETKDWLIGDGTAKNIMVVAANAAINTSSPTPSQITMSSFSSYGPTDDKRIKPDISADGVNLLSCDSESNTAYSSKSGTSMASPSVAGTLILLQQHYNEENGNFMRSSTLRGLAIHTATEAGFYNGPDHRFGWGLINGAAAAQLITSAHDVESAIIEENVLNQGGSYTKQITASGTGKLKVSICWTDPVKNSSINNGVNNSTTPVLTNDLDVRVTKDGETFFPWRLGDIVDNAPIKADNTVDNVEVIEIDSPVAGATYTVTVSHKSLLQAFAPQNYALIISGVTNINGVSDKVAPKVGIYPNPATDVINISLDGSMASEKCDIVLYDIQGREVKKFSTFTGSINVSDVSAGVYVLSLSVNNGEYTESRKVVIE